MSDETGPTPASTYRVKRRHPRACLSTIASIFTDRRPLGPCLVENLSAGGVCLVTASAVRRGRVVTILLELPSEPLVMSAQVSRHQERRPGEHLLALSFLNLGAAETLRLEALVAEALAESHPCLEFFDTDDGSPRRIVLADDAPVVG